MKPAAQTKKLVKASSLKQNSPINQKQTLKQRKDEDMSLEESNKSIGGFNFEHEINKVKIPVPLTELIKSKIYREATFKSFSNAVNPSLIPSDEINL